MESCSPRVLAVHRACDVRPSPCPFCQRLRCPAPPSRWASSAPSCPAASQHGRPPWVWSGGVQRGVGGYRCGGKRPSVVSAMARLRRGEAEGCRMPPLWCRGGWRRWAASSRRPPPASHRRCYWRRAAGIDGLVGLTPRQGAAAPRVACAALGGRHGRGRCRRSNGGSCWRTSGARGRSRHEGAAQLPGQRGGMAHRRRAPTLQLSPRGVST